MKKTTMMVLMAAGLALQAIAADPENNPPNNNTVSTPTASVAVRKTQTSHWFDQYLRPETGDKYQVQKLGGVSSRPWAQTVTWASQTATFAGDREQNQDIHFNLFWIGATPK